MWTASTEDGKSFRCAMTALLCVLSSVSLRGVSAGCSPAPTNASKLVQCSISATLRWCRECCAQQAQCRQQDRSFQISGHSCTIFLPDSAYIQAQAQLVRLERVDLDSLLVADRYAGAVLVEVYAVQSVFRAVQRHDEVAHTRASTRATLTIDAD